jgi:hypothetical protein
MSEIADQVHQIKPEVPSSAANKLALDARSAANSNHPGEQAAHNSVTAALPVVSITGLDHSNQSSPAKPAVTEQVYHSGLTDRTTIVRSDGSSTSVAPFMMLGENLKQVDKIDAKGQHTMVALDATTGKPLSVWSDKRLVFFDSKTGKPLSVNTTMPGPHGEETLNVEFDPASGKPREVIRDDNKTTTETMLDPATGKVIGTPLVMADHF